MVHQAIVEYIHTNKALGYPNDQIFASLIGAGWKREDVQTAFDQLDFIAQSSPHVASPSVSVFRSVSEGDYPIQTAWIIKSLVTLALAILIFIVVFLFGYISYYLILLILYSPVHIVIVILRRKNFHFLVDEKFLTLKQGVINKQQRMIPYGVIQHVFVKQDVLDRLFGLSSVVVENAQNAGNTQVKPRSRDNGSELGFTGNKVSIPGLKSEDAESLKVKILERIKSNPMADTQSGL